MDYYVGNCFYKIFLISIFADLYKSWRWSNKRFSVQELIQVLFIFQEAGGCQETVANDISDFYAEKCNTPEVEQFCRVHNQLATNLMWEFVRFFFVLFHKNSWCIGMKTMWKHYDYINGLVQTLKLFFLVHLDQLMILRKWCVELFMHSQEYYFIYFSS